jgi:hypothetical protein
LVKTAVLVVDVDPDLFAEVLRVDPNIPGGLSERLRPQIVWSDIMSRLAAGLRESRRLTYKQAWDEKKSKSQRSESKAVTNLHKQAFDDHLFKREINRGPAHEVKRRGRAAGRLPPSLSGFNPLRKWYVN